MDAKKRARLADLGLLMTAFVWGSGFIAQKGTLEALGPYNQLSIRFTLSTLLMGLIFFKNIKAMKKSDIKPGIILGLLLFTAYVSQTVGLQTSEVGTAAFITASYVVLVPFIFWAVKKQKPDKYNMIAAVLCTIGIGMIALRSGLVLGKSELLLVICAFIFGAHMVAVGIYTKEHDPILLTVFQMAIAGGLSIICSFAFDKNPFPIASENFLGVAYLAVFSTLICFLLQNICQKYTSPSHAAILLCLESVFGTLLGILFFSESFSTQTIIGFIIVFIAVIVAETKLSFLRKKPEITDDNEAGMV